MRRGLGLLLAMAVGSTGCTSCSDVGPGRYACDPKLKAGTPEGDAQCPGSSRCGLEGFCHDLGDVSRAWKCEADSDCENGYACGLARDHLSRECHDPGVADAGYACEQDRDCVRGWHCGVQQLCYDRAVAGSYACRRDAGVDDCAPGWRCGRDDRCHDTQVAGPYACLDDKDCEQFWRCGLDHQCIDPAIDALRAVNTTLGGIAKTNPLLLDHAPDLIAASPVQRAQFNAPRQFISYVDRGDITVLNLSVGGTPPIGTNPHKIQVLPDAGPITSLATLGELSLNYVAQPDIGSWTYVTRPGGVTEELHFRTTPGFFGFDGGVWRTVTASNTDEPASISNPNWLRVGSSEPGRVPTLLAYDHAPFTGVERTYFYGWGALSRATFNAFSFTYAYDSDFSTFGEAMSAQGNHVIDTAVVSGHYLSLEQVTEQDDCMLIADDRGLFVQQLEADRLNLPKRFIPWPLIAPPFDNALCADELGRPQSHRITQLSTYGRDWAAVTAHPLQADGGVQPDTQVALIDVSRFWDVLYPMASFHQFRGCYTTHAEARCQPYMDTLGIYLPVTATTVLGPCSVCEGGEAVLARPVPSAQGGMKLEVRCRSAGGDAGTIDSIVELTPQSGQGTSCLRKPVELSGGLATESVKLSASNSAETAFAGARGHLWVGATSASAVPVVFDQAATGILAGPTGEPVFLGLERIGWFAPPWGILAFRLYPQDGDRPIAVVAGDPKAIITGARAVATFDQVPVGMPPRQIAAPDGTPTRFDPPYHALRARRSDGASIVLVSAGDVLLSANLSLPRPVLQRRLVPAEGREILSLLALPRATGPFTAFALTRQALFQITSETEQLWTAVPAPMPPGEPLELWADGARGRIGYADGRVFSLETRVQIGASLFKHVDDFAQVCGQVYALAEGTLNRLRLSTGDAIGHWEPVDLGAALPADELEQGTLLPFDEADGGTALHVFSRRGEALRAPVTCP